MAATKRLMRSKDKKIAGVCAGLGDYFDLDPTIVRIIFTIFTIFTAGFPGIFAYLIMWAIMPDFNTDKY